MGKTTCSAAYALALAVSHTPFGPILLVSTDPAHSLGDALAVRLSSTPRSVARGVRAVELDAPRAFTRWLAVHRAALGQALEHGTWLDASDIDALLQLPLPGVDELVGMLEIARLARPTPGPRAHPRIIVVDTAPTGHTLRLLASPAAVATVAEVLDALQQEHRLIRQQFARVGRPEAADRLIALLARQAHELSSILRDPARVSFRWVTLPEGLSVAETGDGIAALERSGIRVDEVIVNRVLDNKSRCAICDRRWAAEARAIARIQRGIGRARVIRVIPAALREPRGIAPLRIIGHHLTSRPATKATVRAPRAPHGSVFSLPADAATVSPEYLDVLKGAALLFVGGKGGVGKTTVAAATALQLARANRRGRTLLLSTDPAHSLADVLGVSGAAVGDVPRTLAGAPPNLVVREIDAARVLAARRADLQQAFDEISTSVGADLARGDAADLIELAPPGIDELFGILSVIGARGDYDLIVVDTAPTGHALRLLELADAARAWVHVLMRVLLKYRSAVPPGQLGRALVDLSQSIRELQTLMHDPSHTRFVVVTRGANVPRLETERLLDRLRTLKLAAPALVINALTLAPGGCRRCRAAAAAEKPVLAAWRRRCRAASRRCVIIQTPLAAPPPRGVAALERWARTWVVDQARQH